mgnify:CR=1 FL=1
MKATRAKVAIGYVVELTMSDGRLSGTIMAETMENIATTAKVQPTKTDVNSRGER